MIMLEVSHARAVLSHTKVSSSTEKPVASLLSRSTSAGSTPLEYPRVVKITCDLHSACSFEHMMCLAWHPHVPHRRCKQLKNVHSHISLVYTRDKLHTAPGLLEEHPAGCPCCCAHAFFTAEEWTPQTPVQPIQVPSFAQTPGFW